VTGMQNARILVVGGGIAGLSVAALDAYQRRRLPRISR